MKPIKLFLLMFLILFSSSVKAECTTKEINNLKKEADKITITYKHLDGIERDNGIDYNKYELEIKSISDKFYVTLDDNDEKYFIENNENTIAINNTNSGKHVIKIYSNECSKIIDTINFRLPKFNSYYYDPLCIGIDGDDFELCGKYYDYDISYEDFKQRVERYRYINKIDENGKQEDNSNSIGAIFSKINNYIKKHKKNILIGVGTLIVLILSTVLIKHKKNRGVLQ